MGSIPSFLFVTSLASLSEGDAIAYLLCEEGREKHVNTQPGLIGGVPAINSVGWDSCTRAHGAPFPVVLGVGMRNGMREHANRTN